ncbi:Qat anti-phage system TatD family nuclease QatD [Pseudomonas gingeri]|uniref:Qat anti-phage system TatD family nuclease QatD n=2 Tax=Pseudomonas gingeri TaxID=117681 RepID=UPI0015A4811D|nr:Qat anti-phage system TatD family nuclease QatD [Pseudomonas gingeri]NWD07102.1 TatD family hydrolase [Pseudomonas gingeri]NWE31701.1 TatD family hydrolase [Pseudomonas gingeri]NWE47310.1 TatD family hydrolase [Pseudomonas gingeri]NWE57282.1 TatD family hydrolase [Pseudomonas gingeri]NWF00167.1 TatD family hydrolase [Pseudomonas gingeri]
MSQTARERPKWVDFHCHLDLYPNHEALIRECDREGVATLAVTTTPKAWARNQEMASTSKHVRVALGLHPQLVAEREGELALFERLLEGTRYVGEIGLDAGPRFYSSFEAQERVFSRILSACSEQGGKILTVHSVRTAAKVLGHIEHLLPPDRGRVVLHWFTGSAAEARRALDLGCYFSINIEMLKSTKHRALVASLPLDRMLTETDGPFVLADGRPLAPRDVSDVIQAIASLKELDQEMVANQIVSNLGNLLRSC